MLSDIGGRSYYITSFTVGADFEFKSFIPTAIDYSFVFDERKSKNSIFLALMATEGRPVPTAANRFSFNSSEVMLPDEKATLSLSNNIFIQLLEDGLKSQRKFKNSSWSLVDGQPAILNLNSTIKNISSGANLKKCTISADRHRIFVYMKLYKKDATPGINLTFKANTKLKLVWDADSKSLKLEPDGKPKVTHKMSEDLWLKILKFISPVAIIEDQIPDVGKALNKKLGKFNIPVSLPKLLVKQGVVISTSDIDYYGGLQVAATIQNE